jgi:hypothetical protein
MDASLESAARFHSVTKAGVVLGLWTYVFDFDVGQELVSDVILQPSPQVPLIPDEVRGLGIALNRLAHRLGACV